MRKSAMCSNRPSYSTRFEFRPWMRIAARLPGVRKNQPRKVRPSLVRRVMSSWLAAVTCGPRPTGCRSACVKRSAITKESDRYAISIARAAMTATIAPMRHRRRAIRGLAQRRHRGDLGVEEREHAGFPLGWVDVEGPCVLAPGRDPELGSWVLARGEEISRVMKRDQ